MIDDESSRLLMWIKRTLSIPPTKQRRIGWIKRIDWTRRIHMNLRVLRARIVNVEFLRWGKWASNLLNTAWAGNMCLLAFLVVFLETFTIFVSGVSLYVQHDRTNWSHSLICAYFPNEGKSFKRFNGKTLIIPCYSVVKKIRLNLSNGVIFGVMPLNLVWWFFRLLWMHIVNTFVHSFLSAKYHHRMQIEREIPWQARYGGNCINVLWLKPAPHRYEIWHRVENDKITRKTIPINIGKNKWRSHRMLRCINWWLQKSREILSQQAINL